MKSKRREFVVGLDLPQGVGPADMARWLMEAIRAYQGSMPAEEPCAALDVRTLAVKTIPNPREVGKK